MTIKFRYTTNYVTKGKFVSLKKKKVLKLLSYSLCEINSLKHIDPRSADAALFLLWWPCLHHSSTDLAHSEVPARQTSHYRPSEEADAAAAVGPRTIPLWLRRLLRASRCLRLRVKLRLWRLRCGLGGRCWWWGVDLFDMDYHSVGGVKEVPHCQVVTRLGFHHVRVCFPQTEAPGSLRVGLGSGPQKFYWAVRIKSANPA